MQFPLFSIVTPTFNRQKLLWRVFESLRRCKEDSFEWIIVDDGSTDDTENVVKGFQKELPQVIKYYKKENGGKHTALNIALDNIEGELTLILDSDDALRHDALKLVRDIWVVVGVDDNCAGVIGLCAYFGSDSVVGERFPVSPHFSTITKNIFKYNIKGDKCDFIRSKYIKRYRFPLLEGEKFIPESLVTYELDKQYHYYCVNQVLKLVEYQRQGITNNYRKLSVMYPNGFYLRFKNLTEQVFLGQMSLLGRLKVFSNYFRFLLHGNYGFFREVGALNISGLDILIAAAGFFLGVSYFFVDNLRYKRSVIL